MFRTGLLLGSALIALTSCVTTQPGAPAANSAPQPTYTYQGVQYRTPEEVLAVVRQVDAERVSQVTPVSDRVGGRVKVVIPDRDRLRPFIRAGFKTPPSDRLLDLAIDARKADLQAGIDGLKRSGMFDTVDVSERNAVEAPDLEGADYLVWYSVRTTGPNNTGNWVGGWRVRKAGSARVEPAVGDPGVAPKDTVVAWVKSVREATTRLSGNAGAGGQPASPASASAGQATKFGSLTGFAISPEGHVLTAHHGVGECREVKVAEADGAFATATVVARDRQNDIAVLKLPHRLAQVATLRDTPSVRTGESVVAVGYPLANMISSNATVTTGSVSALSGVGDDSRFIQFSAPVQPGNSGGPLLDAGGNVAALVESKLNALRVAMATGDIPQNVNFGVKTSVLRIFLDTNGIPYRTGALTRDLRPAEVAEAARRFTVLIECWR
jgi:S1-C subfamily serine protease